MRLLLLGICWAGLAWPQEGPSTFRLLYTGKLLGYARIPDIQRFEEVSSKSIDGKRRYRHVPDPTPSPSPFAGELSRQINLARGAGTSLLLGMGDNFSMDYFSRVSVVKTIQNPDSPPPAKRPERYAAKDELFFKDGHWFDLDEFDDAKNALWSQLEEEQISGKSTIDADNVAGFFRRMGYAALVPGKHDFYFGPERLRQLARLLASDAVEPERPVTMLGANLLIRSTYVDPPLELSERVRAKTRPYSVVAEDFEWALPKTVLPWIRKFALKGAYDANDLALVSEPFVCEQLEPDFLPWKPGTKDPLPSTCRSLKLTQAAKGSTLGKLTLEGKELFMRAELGYLVCVTVNAKAAVPFCQAFNVHAPYLQYPEYTDPGFGGGLRRDRPKQMPVTHIPPYLRHDATNSIIMGAVALGLERQVGTLNAQWINQNAKVDTTAATMDPAEALSQLLEYCKSQGDCTEGKTYILMAQMPREAAEMLNRQLDKRFHIVLAQADSRIATAPNQIIAPAEQNRVVLVPREIYEPNQPLPGFKLKEAAFGVGLQSVEVEVAKDDTGGVMVTKAETRSLTRRAVALPEMAGTDLDVKVEAAWAKLTGQPKDKGKPSAASRFRTVTLEAMRRRRKADIALLQERDFFELEARLKTFRCEPIGDHSEALRATLEGILWKGDFLITRTVKGSALRAALAKSKELKDLEDDVYTVEVERGRHLVTHGLVSVKEPKLSWYVNGQLMEDNTLYSVAMTDFLALGDTGYPDLQTPALPPVERARELGPLSRIADVVHDFLQGKSLPARLSFGTYLDQTDHRAFSLNPPSSFEQEFTGLIRDSFKVHQPPLAIPQRMPNAPGPGVPGKSLLPSTAEIGNVVGQSRPYWRYFVDKSEFGYAEYRHNFATQSELETRFKGIPENSVTSREKRALSTSLQFEARRELPRHHYFLRLEEEYLRERTQQSGPKGVFLSNFPNNQVSLEFGLRKAFRATIRQRPWYGWLASFNGSSQFRSPPVQFQPGFACDQEDSERCPGGEFRAKTARTSRLLGKTGMYIQGRDSWLEAGFFYGRVVRPVAYTVDLRPALVKPTADNPNPVQFRDLISLTCDIRQDFLTQKLKEGTYRTLEGCFNRSFDNATDDTKSKLTLGPVSNWLLRANSELNAERGIFVNFNLRWSLPKAARIDHFKLENRGRWYFNSGSDLVLDTRVNNQLKFGPVIKLYPSLSLNPTYTIFYFRNRLMRGYLLGRSFDLKLEYRFNRKSGDSWRQALGAGWPK